MLKSPKRICLFSGYSINGVIENYVLDYLKELSIYSDVYYLADSQMPESELNKLKPYVKSAWAYSHKKYDFGSYSDLAQNLVGWHKLEEYDELILANDSCYLVNSLLPIFEKMDNDASDVLGLTASDDDNSNKVSFKIYKNLPKPVRPLFNINSYFIIFKKTVFAKNSFKMFFDKVKPEIDRATVCLKYEIGLTDYLLKNNFKINLFVDKLFPKAYMYTENAFRILRYGMPLIKRKIFSEDNYFKIENIDEWVNFVSRVTKNDRIFDYLRQKKQDFKNDEECEIFLFENNTSDITAEYNNAKEQNKGSNIFISTWQNVDQKPYYKLILNIPERDIICFLNNLSKEDIIWLKTIPFLQINIFVFDISTLPLANILNKPNFSKIILSYITNDITMRTNLPPKINQNLADEYNMPVFEMSNLKKGFEPSY